MQFFEQTSNLYKLKESDLKKKIVGTNLKTMDEYQYFMGKLAMVKKIHLAIKDIVFKAELKSDNAKLDIPEKLENLFKMERMKLEEILTNNINHKLTSFDQYKYHIGEITMLNEFFELIQNIVKKYFNTII